MQASDFAKLIHARKEGSKWRGRCPVHQPNARYGRSLVVFGGDDRIVVYCHAGCAKDAVLAALGLTWKDTLYQDKSLTPAEKRKWAKRKAIDEAYSREQRRQELYAILTAINRPKRPVNLTDCAHATMEHRMETYFKSILAE